VVLRLGAAFRLAVFFVAFFFAVFLFFVAARKRGLANSSKVSSSSLIFSSIEC
jgi:hypothetical protein